MNRNFRAHPGMSGEVVDSVLVREVASRLPEIMEKHGGAFPRTVEELRALPGVGDYTAAAVACTRSTSAATASRTSQK